MNGQNIFKSSKVQTQDNRNYSQYTNKKQKNRNIQNKRTNKIAKGIYDYQNDQDVVYGGYTDKIPSQQIEYFHKKD